MITTALTLSSVVSLVTSGFAVYLMDYARSIDTLDKLGMVALGAGLAGCAAFGGAVLNELRHSI